MEDGQARTPPMGWNSWNRFRCNITEQLIKETADALVATGMKDAGYEYVNLDDGWMAPERAADGTLPADPVRFPGSIKALADYVHGKGLKLGIYQDAGTKTCAGNPGSQGHYEQDAATFAAWEVDYLKLDWCYTAPHDDPRALYARMRDALLATGRPIVFSICNWGLDQPWLWGPETGHLWRTTGDIRPSWDIVLNILHQHVGLAPYTGPGRWNDPDMLEVGNGALTDDENRAHFSLWSILAAPLITGNDLRALSQITRDILLNTEAIAVDQDPLGIAGSRLRYDDDHEIWARPLANGDRAVVLLNRGVTSATIGLSARELGLPAAPVYAVRDLWAHADTTTTGLISAVVPPHGAATLRVRPGQRHDAPPATTLSVAPRFFTSGRPTTVTVTLANNGPSAIRDAQLDLQAPDGWAVRAIAAATVPEVPPGGSARATWAVTPAADATPAAYTLDAAATYAGQSGVRVQSPVTVVIPPAPPIPPSGHAYLSDLPWLQASNGAWSGRYPSVKRDRSAGDHPLTLHGATYAKGLGVHAFSEISYYVGGAYATFSADVGVDDDAGVSDAFYGSTDIAAGTVVFQVWADGQKIFDSGLMSRDTPARHVDVPITGREVLTLVVADGGDGTYHDHADWADARVERS